jgi:hypothetical protein
MTDLNKAKEVVKRLRDGYVRWGEAATAADTIDSLVAEVERLKAACDKFSEAEMLQTKVDARKRLTNLRFLGLTNSVKGDGNES